MRTRKSSWPFWPRYHGAMTPSWSSTIAWAKYFFTGGASAAAAEIGPASIPSKSKAGVIRGMAGSFCGRCELSSPEAGGGWPRAVAGVRVASGEAGNRCSWSITRRRPSSNTCGKKPGRRGRHTPCAENRIPHTACAGYYYGASRIPVPRLCFGRLVQRILWRSTSYGKWRRRNRTAHGPLHRACASQVHTTSWGRVAHGPGEPVCRAMVAHCVARNTTAGWGGSVFARHLVKQRGSACIRGCVVPVARAADCPGPWL